MTSVKLISFSIVVVIFAVYVHRYKSETLADVIKVFLSIVHNAYFALTRGIRNKYENPPPEVFKEGETLLTSKQLEDYSSDGELYLSILGKIFDVTKGKKHYGPGGGYHFFTGRDASRAFVTGDFTEAGLSDDILDLSQQQLKGLKEWSNFYEKEYKYVGKLIGRYYDSQGQKTRYLLIVEDLFRDAELKQQETDAEKLKYPPCNIEWRVDKGSRVWCSNKSGGVSRDWIGVPRKLFVLGSSVPRCVCIKQSEEFSLMNPRIEEYPGCPKNSISCWIETTL